MPQPTLRESLASPGSVEAWLQEAGFLNLPASVGNLCRVADVWSAGNRNFDLIDQLGTHLPLTSDPDMALNNFERYLGDKSRAQQNEIDAMMAADANALPSLLALFANSQYLADLLAHDPSVYRELYETGGDRCTREILDERLRPRMQDAATPDQAMSVLRQFKHRETLRIAFGDLIAGHRVEQVAEQISFLAEAICSAAYTWSRDRLVEKMGRPLRKDGLESHCVVLAMGKLGGHELNYSSDIDLIVIYDQDGKTLANNGLAKSQTNELFYEKLTLEIVRLLGENTSSGRAYRVDLRLRPEGSRGKVCCSLRYALRYYDLQGRTWERQAMIKARPIAGDRELGKSILRQLAQWIYRPNVNRTDIGGVKALKRKIERRAKLEGEDRTNIKTGHGGIRDVEFVIQFLQLLNGCLLKEVRGNNTFLAIKRLERAGCLNNSEGNLLFHNYSWLRQLEHRLQIMHDLQTHTISHDQVELYKTARRMGYRDAKDRSALDQFQADLTEKTESNRSILNHLLHGAFQASDADAGDPLHHAAVPLEVDLILDPYPGEPMIRQALSQYGFQDELKTYRRLLELAQESTRFLSPRRCQHFFAAITPALLQEVSQMPDPDGALVSLTTISDSLGAKGVLWELFSFNPPTLKLYIRICALTDYIASILKQNPGMIDELMDALQLQQLPTRAWLEDNLADLSRGAEDLAVVLHSFKSTQHMRIGIRDLVSRDDVRDIHRSLADVASVCLESVAHYFYQQLIRRYAAEGQVDFLLNQFSCPFVILGMGKLGGNEPNYHSDLDVIFLYDSNSGIESYLADGTTGQYFFSELAASIMRFITHSDRYGQLYEIDSRLRPTGKSGALAVSLDGFERYFATDDGQLWERQSLCKARAVFGTAPMKQQVMEVVHRIITSKPWSDEMAQAIRSMRHAMEADCSERNLKRGVGGTVDIEFAIQMLQLKHARDDASVLVPGTLDAITRLTTAGFLAADRAAALTDCYRQLRQVEAQLRLMNTTARHDLPTDRSQLAKLAMLLNHADADAMTESVEQCRQTVRQQFEALFAG